jgi:Fe-S-cluster containining protein
LSIVTEGAALLPLSREQVKHLCGDRRLREALERLYADLDADVAAMEPTCWNRGLCCRFGAAGHRLFVTTLELVYFASGLTQRDGRLREVEATRDRCPYQIDGRCTARDVRPLGCRVYFCQASNRWWQPRMSERWLARLKELHVAFGVPYVYVEWLAGLAAVRELISDSLNASVAREVGE